MKNKKPRFQLTLTKARKGDKHPEISKIQAYLKEFGYLVDKCVPGKLCTVTSTALRRFQRFNRLSVTGTINSQTTKAMLQYRCQNPDPATKPAQLVAGSRVDFRLSGCRYRKTSFTYRFLNGTPDIPGNAEQNAIRNALNTWASVVHITFREVARNRSSDFEFGWFSGAHGDGSSFDGPGNTLAHAFYPPDCGGDHAGKCHFDEAENWNIGSRFDLETVALHEIGHLLGIEHSQDPLSVMTPSYSGIRTTLTAGDIDAVRRIYPVFTRVNDSGNQAGEIKSVKAVRHNNRQVITAVRTASNTLRLISWNVSDAGRINRSGDSGNQVGGASHIDITRIGDRYVTSCRSNSGRLVLISWDVAANGSRFTRLADSGRQAGTATKIKVIALSASLLLTACRAGNGRLVLITWRLNADGSFTRLRDSGNLAGPISDVVVTELPQRGGANRILTTVRTNGRLKLIAWSISNNGTISRIGDSGNQAGTASQIDALLHPSGNIVTSCKAGNGRLVLINWRLRNRAGNQIEITRVADSGTLAGRISRNSSVLMAGGNSFVSGVRTASGTLRLISFSLTPDGRLNRIGDSVDLAGEVSEISLPTPLLGDVSLVSCVKSGDGRLLLISWRP